MIWPSSLTNRGDRPKPSRTTVSPPTLWICSSCRRHVHRSAVGMTKYPDTGYGVVATVSNVPHGSVNSLAFGEASADLPGLPDLSPLGVAGDVFPASVTVAVGL